MTGNLYPYFTGVKIDKKSSFTIVVNNQNNQPTYLTHGTQNQTHF